MDLQCLKDIPILDIAGKLNIPLDRNNKTHCIFPNHNDKNPSMGYWKEKNKFKCFSCGALYTTIDLVINCLDLDTAGAINWIKTQYRIRDTHPTGRTGLSFTGTLQGKGYKTTSGAVKTLHGANTSVLNDNKQPITPDNGKKDGREYAEIYRYFIDLLEYREAVDYMKNHRGIQPAITLNHCIKTIPKNQKGLTDLLESNFNLDRLIDSGLYAISKGGKPYFIFFDNRLISPYFDIDDKTILGLEGRHIDNKNNAIKTLWLKNINKVLYNLKALKDATANGHKICICEGVPDTLSIYQSGKWADWGQPIGIAGIAQTKSIILNLLDRLEGYKLYIATDGDNAGNNFYDDFQTEHVNRYFMPCERVLIPEDKDLNDLLKAGELND